MAIEIPQPGRRARRLIAVCEQRPWWTPQLQQRFVGSDVAVRSCERVQDAIEARPEVAIVAASGDGTAAADGVAELRERAAGAFVIVVLPAELRPAEWRVREIGADSVVGEDVGSAALADLCRWALRAAVN